MKTSDQYVVFDGDIIAANEPAVPVISRGLMYGDGVFETFRTYAGKTLLLDKHIDRLLEGLKLLAINPRSEFKPDRLRQILYNLLKKQQLLNTDAIIRMQVWRGGERGYHPQKNSDTHFSITASVCPDDFSPPTLASVEQRRIPSQSLPSHVKLTNGINYILASRQASEKGADDALMQTIGGWISETTIANIFWCKGDTIFTPDTDCDLIPGITRDVVTTLIKEQNHWQLEEGKYSLSHLSDADAVWICNSVREILAVRKIDGSSFNIDHPVILNLQAQYDRFRKSNIKSLQGDE